MKNLFQTGLAIVWAAAALTFTAPGDAEAKVYISERTKYYSVSGSSGKELFKSISRNGPKNKGTHAIATTRTDIKFRNIKFAKKGRRCVVANVDVVLNLTYTLPRWTGSKRASPQMRRSWEKFNALVVKHEQTHGRISREYARSLEGKLKKLSGSLSNGCADFGRRSKRSMDLLLKGYVRRHTSFDRREGRASSRVRRLQFALAATPR